MLRIGEEAMVFRRGVHGPEGDEGIAFGEVGRLRRHIYDIWVARLTHGMYLTELKMKEVQR